MAKSKCNIWELKMVPFRQQKYEIGFKKWSKQLKSNPLTFMYIDEKAFTFYEKEIWRYI